jgi:aldose 1-epimerase
MQEACKVEAAGLSLEVSTNQRGVQIYNGLHIQTGASRGHGGRAYGPCAGLAIEPQFWPDTPHQPGYPSSLISPGQVSKHRSRFEFATND